jgi:hypothetical protein
VLGRRTAWLILCGAISGAVAASAEQILLDEPVRAGDLFFFQQLGDESTWFYAPAKARLAMRGDGTPEFSFLRYVENASDASAEQSEGEGGGIVHALIELRPTPEQVDAAVGELRKQRPNAKSAGPVAFAAGKFGLVSSFKDDKGDLTTRVLGLGSAPVLEGSKAALSIQLSKLGAKILAQSFQSATPDVSFQLEMELAGFRAPRQAVIEADLDRVYEHAAFRAGATTTWSEVQISQALSELYQQGAIQLTQVGEGEDLKRLVDAAYSKLTQLIFAPSGAASPAQVPQAVGAGRPTVAALMTWEMKKTRQRGHYRVDLRKYTADTLALRFDENIGDLRRWLDNPAIFHDANLDDPLYRRREVIASLVGVDDADFASLLSFVNLQIRKKHESGDDSFEETQIDRGKFNALGNLFRLAYGWKGDENRRRFREFDYRTIWAFRSGRSVEDAWQRTSFSSLPLSPPFAKRSIQLEADKSRLDRAGVRSISVQLTSELAGQPQTTQVTLNAAHGELSKTLDLIVPRGTATYGYEIRWRLRGNQTRTTGSADYRPGRPLRGRAAAGLGARRGAAAGRLMRPTTGAGTPASPRAAGRCWFR